MNIVRLNTVSLDGIIKKGSGGGGGVPINNQEKSLEITENGVTEVTADAAFTGLSKVVVNTNVQSGGGASVSKPVNDVNFYDYDGTILHSYTKNEFLAMSTLPPLPEKEGLICQEWNWRYEEAQEYVAEYGLCDIGATYITDDGATRLLVGDEHTKIKNVAITIHVKNTEVAIDWGDGSEPVVLTSSYNGLTHEYDKKGAYCISIRPKDGGTCYLGNNKSPTIGVMGSFSSMSENLVKLRHVHTGDTPILFMTPFCKSVALQSITASAYLSSTGSEAFNGCYSLKSFVWPKNITQTHMSIFASCYTLESVSLPIGITKIESSMFKECYMLRSIVIPSSVTSIGSYAFYNCYSLSSVVIPSSVTSIGSHAFTYCLSMGFYDFSSHTSVPSLDSDAFYGISSECKIIVPDTLYDEWIAATNWSSYASYIIKKSDWDAQNS